MINYYWAGGLGLVPDDDSDEAALAFKPRTRFTIARFCKYVVSSPWHSHGQLQLHFGFSPPTMAVISFFWSFVNLIESIFYILCMINKKFLIWRNLSYPLLPTLSGLLQGGWNATLAETAAYSFKTTEAKDRMNLFLPSHQIPLSLQRAPSL